VGRIRRRRRRRKEEGECGDKRWSIKELEQGWQNFSMPGARFTSKLSCQWQQ
jgi:hypothetical protein